MHRNVLCAVIKLTSEKIKFFIINDNSCTLNLFEFVTPYGCLLHTSDIHIFRFILSCMMHIRSKFAHCRHS